MTNFHVYNCISFTSVPSKVTAFVDAWQFRLAEEDNFLFATRVM